MEKASIGGAVFTRSKDTEVAIRGDCDIWENPLAQIVGVICERISCERGGERIWVMDFDPIRRKAILISYKSAGILG